LYSHSSNNYAWITVKVLPFCLLHAVNTQTNIGERFRVISSMHPIEGTKILGFIAL